MASFCSNEARIGFYAHPAPNGSRARGKVFPLWDLSQHYSLPMVLILGDGLSRNLLFDERLGGVLDLSVGVPAWQTPCFIHAKCMQLRNVLAVRPTGEPQLGSPSVSDFSAAALFSKELPLDASTKTSPGPHCASRSELVGASWIAGLMGSFEGKATAR